MNNQEGSLERDFDAVVFLTGSDIENELVSNRFHWASRFAQHLPVFFLQNRGEKQKLGTHTKLGAVKLDGFQTDIKLVNCSRPITRRTGRALAGMLQRQGVERPLFWVYDITNYKELLILYPHALVVLHATENYLVEQSFVSHTDTSKKVNLGFWARVLLHYRTGLDKSFGRRIVESLPLAHMIVAVSSGIQQTYLNSGYRGKILLIQNGVDQNFWGGGLGAAPEPRVAVFQGAINIRLDFELLLAVSRLLPNWAFRFIGSETADPDWVALKGCSNVEYLGKMSQATLRTIVQNSAVGLLPFKQVPLLFESFPLKAFEYIAAGLPVVSTPIRDLQFLQKENGILRFADGPEEFSSAIETLASSRLATSVSKRRLVLAADASYDSKFDRVRVEIRTLAELNSQVVRPSKAIPRKIRRSGKPNRGVRLTASFFAEGWRTLLGARFSLLAR